VVVADNGIMMNVAFLAVARRKPRQVEYEDAPRIVFRSAIADLRIGAVFNFYTGYIWWA